MNEYEAARRRNNPGFKETKGQGFTITESPRERRIIITFEQRQPYEVIALIKGMGFRWSRSQLGWTRYLNSDGRRAAEFVADRLNKAPTMDTNPPEPV